MPQKKRVPTYVASIKDSLDRRKKGKAFYDNAITLSSVDKENHYVSVNLSSGYVENKPTRLIDEGAITYEGGDDIRLYIKKGAVQAFYDSLSSDYVGYINLAHIDIASLPLNLGTWTKDDLTVVDIGDGRKGLDVNVKLNRELHIVQDLLKQEIPLSISAELRGTLDLESSFKFNAPFYNEIEIAGFSVVANPANVNSTGENLNSKGDSEMNLWEKILKLSSENKEENKNEALESKEEEKEEKEPSKEEKALESKEEGTESKEEDKKGEETLETVEMSKDDMEKINKFMDAFEALSAKVEALEQENAELKEKLKSSKKEKTEFEKKAESTLDRLSSLISGQVKDKEKKEEKLSSTSKVSGDMWG
nr:MAG TPA: cell division protein [Caudoviricetes sp.]